MKIIRCVIAMLWLMFFCRYAHASHIVGGEITYTKLGSNKYLVKLVLFVDCVNGQPQAIAQDKLANIGIFDADFNFLDSFSIVRTGPTRIDNASYTCIIPPSNACVDMYLYEKTITLKDTVGGYILAYQRCCRNKTITNIIDPANTGATYFTKIPEPALVDSNSSPAFESLPPNFLCVNETFVFDHSAFDADGDSLIYELYTPYEGGTSLYPLPRPPAAPSYNSIQWRNTYSAIFPFGTNSKLEVDAATGKLTFLPKSIGQFVVGVLVKEYRNGKLIGETRRDYQFNVLPCELSVKAGFNAPPIYCRKEIQFSNAGMGDSFLWDFGVQNSVTDTSTAINPVFTFPANGTYKVWQLAISGNCVDSFSREITIKDPKDYFFTINDTTICYGDAINLGITASSDDYAISWLPDKWLSDANIPNPVAKPQETITYFVTKTFQNCSYTDSVTIRVNQPKAHLFSPQMLCKKEVAFTNLGIADSFFWDFGVENSQDDTSTAINPSFTFPTSGTYTVRLRARLGNCEDIYSKEIVILDPEEDIKAINDTAICYGSSVELGVSSVNAGYTISWYPEKWLDDVSVPNPVAKPLKTITYKVTKTFNNCSFTDSVTITVNNPVVEMSYEIKQECDRNQVIFSTAASDSVKYFWHINNKIVSTEANPALYFPYGENVNGYLYTSAGEGCNDTKPFSFDFPGFNALDFFVPNVITPNGDGDNDCFGAIIRNYDIKCVQEMYIYNRWGELVFRNDKPCWDGTDSRNGKPLAEGTYFYVLTIGGKTYNGTVTLLR